jgi:hypothetical protein
MSSENERAEKPMLLKELREINNELEEMLVFADQVEKRRVYKKFLFRVAVFIDECERTIQWGKNISSKGKPRYSERTLQKINEWIDAWVDTSISIMQEFPIERSIFTASSVLGRFVLFKKQSEISDRDLPDIPSATYTRKHISTKKYLLRISRDYSESDLPVYSPN